MTDEHRDGTMLDDDALLSARQVRAMLGDVSEMTIWRWERDPHDPLPESIWIRRRKYKRRRALHAWIDRRAAAGTGTEAA